eukprot:TRINITY_DN13361_c0_g1_i1.p1 TRINITY_DN13361_c0_g1~~TRINITY_DN13361_c0_g1_i1.p1  ORF type:complete len:117 (-),score=5.47 TRINITY_DN13361_c0_g1_i1:378-728(-)
MKIIVNNAVNCEKPFSSSLYVTIIFKNSNFSLSLVEPKILKLSNGSRINIIFRTFLFLKRSIDRLISHIFHNPHGSSFKVIFMFDQSSFGCIFSETHIDDFINVRLRVFNFGFFDF